MFATQKGVVYNIRLIYKISTQDIKLIGSPMILASWDPPVSSGCKSHPTTNGFA